MPCADGFAPDMAQLFALLTESTVTVFGNWLRDVDQGRMCEGYKETYTPKIVMHCTSKGQDSKCDKFPTG